MHKTEKQKLTSAPRDNDHEQPAGLSLCRLQSLALSLLRPISPSPSLREQLPGIPPPNTCRSSSRGFQDAALKGHLLCSLCSVYLFCLVLVFLCTHFLRDLIHSLGFKEQWLKAPNCVCPVQTSLSNFRLMRCMCLPCLSVWMSNGSYNSARPGLDSRSSSVNLLLLPPSHKL